MRLVHDSAKPDVYLRTVAEMSLAGGLTGRCFDLGRTAGCEPGLGLAPYLWKGQTEDLRDNIAGRKGVPMPCCKLYGNIDVSSHSTSRVSVQRMLRAPAK